MKITQCTFHGIENCLKLEGDRIELIVTTAFGPRVLSCALPGGENFFKLFEEDLAHPRAHGWHSFGGHRLWHAPESFPRTYAEDNSPVPYRIEDGKLFLDCPEETENHLKKNIVISISGSRVKLEQSIRNTGKWNKALAVWALTVMAPGTTAIIPQEKFIPHGPGAGESFAPARPVVLWHFTDMADSRFTWGTKKIELRETGGAGSKLKFGVNNHAGFVAGERGGQYFVKYYDSQPEAAYPDFGCNSEFFTMPGMLEIETLSPLRCLEPGESASLTEEWELFAEKPDFIAALD